MTTTLFTKHLTHPKPESKQDTGKVDLNCDFHHACRRGDYHRARFVLGQCVDNSAALVLNNIDPQTGLSPLSTTILRGHRDLSLYLISLDVDIHLIDDIGWTALHWAIHMGSIELACHLIRAGAKINNPQHTTTCLQLSINERFGLVDAYCAQQIEQTLTAKSGQITTPTTSGVSPQQNVRSLKKDTTTPAVMNNEKIIRIQDVVSHARVNNNPQELDGLYSLINAGFGPKENNIWNFFAILSQPQACVDFAERALKETPLSKEYGDSNIDGNVIESDNESICASDSSEDESD